MLLHHLREAFAVFLPPARVRIPCRMDHGRVRCRALLTVLATVLTVLPWTTIGVAETRVLRVGDHALTVEVAITHKEQKQGLMGREHLDENAGMLFVWNDEAPRVMWMKDTLIPLSVAFVDAGGTIVNIERMTPRTTTLHWSSRPARYAIEARQGWFHDRGIGDGARVCGLDSR